MLAKLFITSLAALACLVPSSLVFAMPGVLVDSLGFESPDYSVGSLQGQNGWVTSGGGGGTAVVQTDVKLTGDQAVQVDRGTGSDDRWAVPVTPFTPQRFLDIRWDMRVEQTTGGGGFGPFFGVDVYDDNGIFGVLGSLGVDATTGDVLYQLQDTGQLVEAGATVSLGDWLPYHIRLDFLANEYSIIVAGSLLATTGFVDRGTTGGNDLDEFTDADIAAFAAVGETTPGTAYFDNFIVQEVLAGDYNGNGIVDAADYTVWRDNVGQPVAAFSSADGTGDGEIGAADYDLWKANFGTFLSGSGSALGAGSSPTPVTSSVPEPSSLVLALFLFLSAAAARGYSRAVSKI